MYEEIPTFDDAVRFHGHVCPGLALGYLMATGALRALASGRAVDEDFVAVAETDACSLDAIQVVCGCTAGKGNLIVRDWGKHACTFYNRVTGKAVRMVVRSDIDLESLVPEGGDPEVRRERIARAIVAMPADEMLKIEPVSTPIPEKARIVPSVTCSVCGELVAGHRVRTRDGRPVCIPCSES
ncbi:MAG: FmdE family protein [Methanomicrobiales archaeon]